MAGTGATREGTTRAVAHLVVDSSPHGAVVRAEGVAGTAVRLPAGRETTALLSGLARLPRHPHREHLVDLGADRFQAVLVTSPPVVTTLERILLAGRVLPLGALVTLLGPIAEALRDAAAAGVEIVPRADTIGLTAEGAPVLLLSVPGRACEEASPASALRALILRCASLCPEILDAPDEEADLTGLEAFLYRSAPPLPLGSLLEAEPIDRGSASAPEKTRVPGREWWAALRRRLPRLAPGRARSAEDSSRESAPPARHRRRHPLDGWRDRAAATVVRRRGPLAAAAVILIGTVIASGVEARPIPEPSSSASSPRRDMSEPPSPTPAPLPGPGAAPEDAARELVAIAVDCGTNCTDDVTTDDSPLRSRSAESLATLLAPGTVVGTVLADANGATALVHLEDSAGTTAASVLIIRTEAGWLIRDVYSEGPTKSPSDE